jgi:HEAT repeat protein
MMRWLGWFAVILGISVVAWRFRPGPSFAGHSLAHWRAVVSARGPSYGYGPGYRYHALAAGGPDAIPVLLQLIQDPDEEVRSIAVECLANQRTSRQRPMLALAVALHDPSEKVRRDVALCLRNFEGDGIALLREATRDDSGLVRIAAAESLWMVTRNPDEAVPVLIEQLDSHPYKATRALGEIGPPARQAIPALLKRLPKDSSEAWANMCALHRLGYVDAEIRKAMNGQVR